MRIKVSIFTPKAFSMRKAISPDKPELLFNSVDKVGRETFRTRAAAVTDKPLASMISVRMKSPGCGGFSMGTGVFSLVIVLKVHFVDLVARGVDAKGQAPVPCDVEAPCALKITG